MSTEHTVKRCAGWFGHRFGYKIGPAARYHPAVDDVALRQLSLADTDAYYSLVDRNRGHLTCHGDYTFAVDATPELIRNQLTEIPRETTAFGIWVGDDLAGRVDLIRHTPERFGLGYWLGEAFTGRGIATAAVAAAIDLRP